MNFLRPNKTKTVIFLAFALSMIVSNACLALYIPIEADLTSNSGFFVDSEIRPVNVCDSHRLNAVGRYRAILFAPLLAAAGILTLPPSTQHELLYASPALVLLFGYAIICLVATVVASVRDQSWTRSSQNMKPPRQTSTAD